MIQDLRFKNKKNLLSPISYLLSLQPGFTLIELLAVISIIAILSVVGIASFLSYSKTVSLNTAVSDVTTLLNLAKSRAQSQVKPSGISCTNLDGYRVVINLPKNSYHLEASCINPISVVPGAEKTLPKNVCFSCEIPPSIYFHVFTGAVDGASNIGILGEAGYKAVSVSNTGVIQQTTGSCSTACQ